MTTSLSGSRVSGRGAETGAPATRGSVGFDLLTVGFAVALVAAAVSVGVSLNQPDSGVELWAPAAPLYGGWDPRIGASSAFAVLLAILVVAWGPALAARLRWPVALAATYAGAVAWTLSLALIDGWDRGFAGRLNTKFEYLREVGGITDIPAMLAGFVDRIPVSHPAHWTVHASGHPPGATLVFVWLDRIGLSGGAAAATVTVLVGCLFAVAVPVTLRALGAPAAARSVLPFAVLFPGVVWLGVSADGLFTGVMATGIAMLALAARARGYRAVALACAAGLTLGFGMFLSYGFVLFGPLALAVVAYLRTWRVLLIAVGCAVAVVGVFAFAGFWWLDGYFAVVERYYADVGLVRPFEYWVWANLAALVVMIGLAVVVALRRLAVDVGRYGWGIVPLLVACGLFAILAADLSGLSKAETERIWLPFAVWLLPAVALLPERGGRWWLASQAAIALAVSHLIWTWW